MKNSGLYDTLFMFFIPRLTLFETTHKCESIVERNVIHSFAGQNRTNTIVNLHVQTLSNRVDTIINSLTISYHVWNELSTELDNFLLVGR